MISKKTKPKNKYRIDKEFVEYAFKNITINIPPFVKTAIKLLIDNDDYPSRSEFIRKAIKKKLDEYEEIDNLLQRNEMKLEDTDEKMAIVTVNIVEDHKNQIDNLINKKLFTGRSEFIREAAMNLIVETLKKKKISSQTFIPNVIKVLNDYKSPKIDEKKWDNTFEEEPEDDFEIF